MLLRFVGKVANFYVEPFCYSAKKVITHIDPPCFNVAQVRLSVPIMSANFFCESPWASRSSRTRAPSFTLRS